MYLEKIIVPVRIAPDHSLQNTRRFVHTAGKARGGGVGPLCDSLTNVLIQISASGVSTSGGPQ